MRSYLVTLALLPLLGLVASDPVPPITQFLSEAQRPGFNGTIWAVLVAGSNGYYNYRHQADVCHAYQVLSEHGIPDDKMVVLMYDDIAQSEENPIKGNVINKPGGSNLYPGVPKDFISEEVTPENFLKVLQGDAELASQGKKVVKSGPNDHIFVFFADHGAPGLIAFPSSELDAQDLNNALKSMHQQNKYAKMVLYIEACESGSMFKGLLPSNLNIFATTAANDVESSYACYYDQTRETYLGDVYSVNWLEDSDKRRSLTHETLSSQFKLVQKETNTSHVQEFGDLSLGSLHVSEFQGSKASSKNVSNCAPTRITDAVPSHDVPLLIARERLRRARGEEATRLHQVYTEMAEGRVYMERAMRRLASAIRGQTPVSQLMDQKQTITRHSCYRSLRETFDEHCFDLSTHPFALRFLYVLVNVCEALDLDNEAEAISSAKAAISNHCQSGHVSRHSFKQIL
jgi:legumain